MLRCTSGPCWRLLQVQQSPCFPRPSSMLRHTLQYVGLLKCFILQLCWPSLTVTWGKHIYICKSSTNKTGASWGKYLYLQSEQDEQRHIVHASLHPFLQSHGPAVVSINCCHHVCEHLFNHNTKNEYLSLLISVFTGGLVCHVLLYGKKAFFLIKRFCDWIKKWCRFKNELDSYRSEFSHIPAQVVSSPHHLGDYTIHFLQ